MYLIESLRILLIGNIIIYLIVVRRTYLVKYPIENDNIVQLFCQYTTTRKKYNNYRALHYQFTYYSAIF